MSKRFGISRLLVIMILILVMATGCKKFDLNYEGNIELI